MRLQCKLIEQRHGLSSGLKGVASTITLTKKPASHGKDAVNIKNQHFIHVCTSTNKSGISYSLQPQNVIKIYDRFIRDGKATIRLTTPSPGVDLLLSGADPLHLEAFLRALRSVVGDCNNGPHFSDKQSLLCSYAAPKMTEQDVYLQRTSLKICCKEDYPTSSRGFPPRLRNLFVMENVGLRRIECRVLQLYQLTCLYVERGNLLTELPIELSHLGLLELKVRGNRLVQWPAALLIRGSRLCTTLQHLDLSANNLSTVPSELAYLLPCLTTLRMDDNCLSALPRDLFCLDSLRQMTVSNNRLRYLPATFRPRVLQDVELHGNQPLLLSGLSSLVRLSSYDSPATLYELCLRLVAKLQSLRKQRFIGLPLTILSDLVQLRTCSLPGCTLLCLEAAAVEMRQLSVDQLAWNCTSIQGETCDFPQMQRFCSAKCVVARCRQ